MAVTYGFFNSVNGDRKYNAEQMSEYFRGIINEGVYQHLDGGLAVTAGTGLAVNVAAGRAIIQNRWIQNSAAMSLTIAAASETYARKDAVVIRLNWSSRAISIAVKTGTPAASPVAPSMTRNSTTYEMALAYVNVAANATSVTVTDKRSDSTVCGWVTVAQSTSGEVDAQLNAMKTGFDGVTYPSPVAMVQGCDQKLQNELSKQPKVFDQSVFSNNYIYYNPYVTNTYNGTYKSKVLVDGLDVTGATKLYFTFEMDGISNPDHKATFQFTLSDTTTTSKYAESTFNVITVPVNAVSVKIYLWCTGSTSASGTATWSNIYISKDIPSIRDEVTFPRLEKAIDASIDYAGASSGIIGWEIGYLNNTTGAEETNSRFIRSDFFNTDGNNLTIFNEKGNREYEYKVLTYDANKTFVSISGYYSEKRNILTTSPSNYYRIIFHKVGGSPVMTDTSISAYLHIFEENIVSTTINKCVPSYWLDTLESKVAAIISNRQSVLSKNHVEFFLLGDPHYESGAKMAPNLINYLSDRLKIRNLVVLGDIEGYENTAADIAKEFTDFFKAFDPDIKIFNTNGNHDFNRVNLANSYPFQTENSLYNHIYRQQEWFMDTNLSVWGNYVDDATHKIRYINIDSSSGITDAAKTILYNAVTSLTSGWGYVIITHSIWDMQQGEDPEIPASVETYFESVLNYTPEGVTPIAILCGHIHQDLDTLFEGTDKSIQVIATTTDSWYSSAYVSSYEMEVGTITESAFDIVQVDIDNKKIYMTRIGVGSNREFTFD